MIKIITSILSYFDVNFKEIIKNIIKDLIRRIDALQKERKIKRKVKEDLKVVEDAKKPDDIRAAHRRNTDF